MMHLKRNLTSLLVCCPLRTFEMVNSNNEIHRSIGAVIQKPDVIMDYNVTMSGVDLDSRVLIRIVRNDAE